MKSLIMHKHFKKPCKSVALGIFPTDNQSSCSYPVLSFNNLGVPLLLNRVQPQKGLGYYEDQGGLTKYSITSLITFGNGLGKSGGFVVYFSLCTFNRPSTAAVR